MNGVGFLESVNSPSFGMHFIIELIDTGFNSFFEFKANDHEFSFSYNFNFRNFSSFFSNIGNSRSNFFASFFIPFLSIVHHGEPGTSDRSRGSRSRRLSSGVKTTRPFTIREISGLSEFRSFVQTARNSFRGHSVFMVVTRNRSDSWNLEIEGGNFDSIFFGKRNNETSEARINVESTVVF